MPDSAIWEKLPDETDLAFLAFTIYRDSPLIADNDLDKRNLKNVATKMGHSAMRTVETWSVRHRWVDRAAAYDAYRDHKMLAVREASMADYVQRVNAMDTQGASLAYRIAIKALAALQARQAADGDVSVKEISDAILALKRASDLLRRSAGLATAFATAQAEQVDPEQKIFYVGDDD